MNIKTGQFRETKLTIVKIENSQKTIYGLIVNI